MPLNLRLKTGHTIPIDMRGLSVGISDGSKASQIANLMIRVGKRSVSVGECFDISGEAGKDREFSLSGDLSKVHSIGRAMTGGSIIIKSTKIGRHVGTGMSGGSISVHGDVGDFLGAEMTGGKIWVSGNAGDYVGAALEGAKYGMNRGEIFIEGDAGVGLGKRMRRGVIVVGGDVGQLAAWDMLAGTIVVLGSASAKTAAGISRGTVVLAGGDLGSGPSDFSTADTSKLNEADDRFLGAGFTGGGNGGRSSGGSGGLSEPQIVRFLANWLKKRCPESMAKSVEQKLLGRSFLKYNGVQLNHNRAEIFVRIQDVSAS